MIFCPTRAGQFSSQSSGRSTLIQQRYGNVQVAIRPSITHANKLRISPAWNGMRFEFVEPRRSAAKSPFSRKQWGDSSA